MDGQLGQHHAGDVRRENGESRAQRIIAAEWKRLGWTEAGEAAEIEGEFRGIAAWVPKSGIEPVTGRRIVEPCRSR